MPLPALVLKPLVGLAPPLQDLEAVDHDNTTGVIQPLLACLEPPPSYGGSDGAGDAAEDGNGNDGDADSDSVVSSHERRMRALFDASFDGQLVWATTLADGSGVEL